MGTDARTERSCWTTDLWLRRCEGFRVFADGEPIGFVEDVLECEDDQPAALVVRVDEVFSICSTFRSRQSKRSIPAADRVLIGPLAAGRMKTCQLPSPTEV